MSVILYDKKIIIGKFYQFLFDLTVKYESLSLTFILKMLSKTIL